VKLPDWLWGLPYSVGAGALSIGIGVGVKCLGCEIKNSPPSSAKFKNEWNETSASPMCIYDADNANITFFTCKYTLMQCFLYTIVGLKVYTGLFFD
jgi:hypothetical protein